MEMKNDPEDDWGRILIFPLQDCRSGRYAPRSFLLPLPADPDRMRIPQNMRSFRMHGKDKNGERHANAIIEFEIREKKQNGLGKTWLGTDVP